jgi:sodium transport system permease protein
MRLAQAVTIFKRETRDQFRDRRTLFMIFVLPILLYPMLGFGVVKLAEAFGNKARSVVMIGVDDLPATPALLNPERNGFDLGVLDDPRDAKLFEVRTVGRDTDWNDRAYRRAALRERLTDVVVIVPPDLKAELARETKPTEFDLSFDSADEKSRDTAHAVKEFLANWNDKVVRARLKRDDKSEGYLQPVTTSADDVATREEASGSLWGRLFPFLLVMMSLTGAFYPAVDLCAGEKERGTMETLLVSPASRGEIVFGKFLTIIVFSMGTALLNLAGMAFTGIQLARQVGAVGGGGGSALALGAPSAEAIFWMILLLFPLSVFFSALCLALGIMARSMKEGQYYMTPLYMVVMPLVFVTLAPGVELSNFTSLVPVTGVALLLRALLQGEYAEARRYFLQVLIPLVVYGMLALRWAVEQFRRESVLFRESERFSLADWLRHVRRDRGPIPNSGAAVFCFTVMMAAAWFSFSSISTSAIGIVQGQAAYILGPTVVLTLWLTSSPRRTLRLYWPSTRYLLIAAALAIAINPLAGELRVVVDALFPISDVVKAGLSEVMGKIPDLGTAILILAIVPAICEELAFRGFILSGLEHDFKPWSAILFSAFLFGFLHVLLSLFQQLFNASLLGVILGLLAIRSRSILPGIVFHAINNTLAIVLGTVAEKAGPEGAARHVFRDSSQALYHVHWVVFGGVVSAFLIYLLVRDTGRRGKGLDSAGTDWG